MGKLVESVNGLSGQVQIIRQDLAARQEPFVYEMAIRAVVPPHRRRRGHADDTE